MKRLALCFLLSGFAALLYETVWMRQLAVALGTSELATVTVLAAFMGGLGAGSWLGEWLSRAGLPGVRVYAVLEWSAALGALLVAPSGDLAVKLLGGQAAPPASGGLAQSAVFFLSGVALLAWPTVALGATLPVLARAVVRRSEEVTPAVAGLYSLNLAGAVAGTLAAAFGFIPLVGLTATVRVGAAANLAAGVLAWTLHFGPSSPPPEAVPAAPVSRAGLLFAGLTGAAGMAYEVLWTRILSQVCGSSQAAFAVTLAACLTGLGLGSAGALRWSRERRTAWIGLGVSQLGAALLFSGAGWVVARTSLTQAALLLVPPFVCQGAAFTFVVRLLATDAGHCAQAAGRAYRWNTAGAVAATVVTGFVLLPGYGLAGTGLLLCGCSLLLALGALVGSSSRPAMAAGSLAAALTGLAVLAAHASTDPAELLRRTPGGGRVQGELIYAATGPSANVALTRDGGSLSLFVDGVGQASVRLRGAAGVPSSQEWLGLLPAALRPGARSALLIGLGLGEALEGLPGAQVDVVEIEPAVIEAWQLTQPLRRSGHRSAPRLVVNDARGALRLTSKQYDVVIGQASHPWTAAASHLYTREFLGEVRRHLTPGGIYVQWLGLQGVDELRFRSLAASLLAEFAHVELFEPVPGLPAFFASESPLEVPSGACREDLLAARRLDEPGVRQLAAGVAPNTDDRNLFASPRGAGPPLGLEGLQRLVAELARPTPAGLDLPYFAHRLVQLGFASEAARLPQDPLVLARARWAGGDHRGAVQALGARDDEASRFLRLKSRLWPYTLQQPEEAGFSDPYAVVVRAAARAAAGDWAAVERLEGGLAGLSRSHLAYETAVQLRAAWRLERGQPGEAVALLDEALSVAWDPYSLVLRAQAARADGDEQGAWESLRDLVGLLWWSRRHPAAPGRLADLLRTALPSGDHEGIAGHLRALLQDGRVY